MFKTIERKRDDMVLVIEAPKPHLKFTKPSKAHGDRRQKRQKTRQAQLKCACNGW